MPVREPPDFGLVPGLPQRLDGRRWGKKVVSRFNDQNLVARNERAMGGKIQRVQPNGGGSEAPSDGFAKLQFIDRLGHVRDWGEQHGEIRPRVNTDELAS